MTTKPLSEKQIAARKAASERLKAMHAKKKAEKMAGVASIPTATVAAPPAEPEDTPEPQPAEVPPDAQAPVNPAAVMPQLVTLTQDQFQQMLDRIAARPEPSATPEAIAQAFPTGAPPNIDASGRVTGIIERYPIDPKFYKSPVDELYDTPELRRWNLRENWVIEWSVTPVKYQTAMGTWYMEPRFELVLKRKQFDPDNPDQELIKYDQNNVPYHPRIVWGRNSFFEDPPANLLEAEQAGLTMDDIDSPDFGDKMRMYRYKFWLIEKIQDKKPNFTTSTRQEEVIGGKVYEIDNSSQPYKG